MGLSNRRLEMCCFLWSNKQGRPEDLKFLVDLFSSAVHNRQILLFKFPLLNVVSPMFNNSIEFELLFVLRAEIPLLDSFGGTVVDLAQPIFGCCDPLLFVPLLECSWDLSRS